MIVRPIRASASASVVADRRESPTGRIRNAPIRGSSESSRRHGVRTPEHARPAIDRSMGNPHPMHPELSAGVGQPLSWRTPACVPVWRRRRSAEASLWAGVPRACSVLDLRRPTFERSGIASRVSASTCHTGQGCDGRRRQWLADPRRLDRRTWTSLSSPMLLRRVETGRRSPPRQGVTARRQARDRAPRSRAGR